MKDSVSANPCTCPDRNWQINPFSTNITLLYPPENIKNWKFSDVFGGYGSGTLVKNGLKESLKGRNHQDFHWLQCDHQLYILFLLCLCLWPCTSFWCWWLFHKHLTTLNILMTRKKIQLLINFNFSKRSLFCIFFLHLAHRAKY